MDGSGQPDRHPGMFFSQTNSSIFHDGIDLNAELDEFAHISSYQQMLQGSTVDVAGGSRLAGRGRGDDTVRAGAVRRTQVVGDAASNLGVPFRPPRTTAVPSRGVATPASSRTLVDGGNGHPQAPGNIGDNETHEDEDELSMDYSSTDGNDETILLALEHVKARKRKCTLACIIGMYYYETYMNKGPAREPDESGYEWVTRTLSNPTECFNMFRMSRPLFEDLHDLLVSSYGLKTTQKMSSVEALAMFLWMIGAPQSVRQSHSRFKRSTETISHNFYEVLHSVYLLSVQSIKPIDPEFRNVHPKLKGTRFSPYFDGCIGDIDGTHIKVVVPADKVVQHVG